MAIEYAFIEEFLGKVEGRGVATGYIPRNSRGKILGVSGVTIGTGIDLGQQSAEGLAAMGIAPGIVGLLTPYLGLKGEAAANKLERLPLIVRPDVVAALDRAVRETYTRETAAMFGTENFESAPREVQAVATSLHYQFGKPWRESSPSLGKAWEAMRFGRYAEAAGHLRNTSGWSESHQKYMRRRKVEADLLERAAR